MKILANQLNTPINSAKRDFAKQNLQSGENANAQPFGASPRLFTIKSEKIKNFFESMGKMSTPMNRFLIGAVAISSQPLIDLHNKDVDEETRKTSFWRTIAKIVVGTTTGIIARVACISAMDRFTYTTNKISELKMKGKEIPKWATALVPDFVTSEKFANAERLLGKHKKALGSFIAIGVMLLTDPPLTKFLTNYFNDKRKKAERANAMKKGVSNV